MNAKVVQFNNIGPVTFQKNRRSKNIKIRVKPDKTVHVSFPFYVSGNEAAAFVSKNTDWISTQQQKFDSKKQDFLTESSFKTKMHSIDIIKGEQSRVQFKKENIKIYLNDLNSDDSRHFVKNILDKVYRFEALCILPKRLAELAKKHELPYAKVTIRNNRRNWGSCSARNNISLNLQMMKLPDELINYILLHELVHTKVKNHGPSFWAKLNELTENRAREIAKQVGTFSTYTL